MKAAEKCFTRCAQVCDAWKVHKTKTGELYTSAERESRPEKELLESVALRTRRICHILDQMVIYMKGAAEHGTDKGFATAFGVFFEKLAGISAEISGAVEAYTRSYGANEELEQLLNDADKLGELTDEIRAQLDAVCAEKAAETDAPKERVVYKYVKNGKRLEFRHGDLSRTERQYDIVVCSAYKNSYIPTSGTLIAALLANKGICVHELSKDPLFEHRKNSCWLSGDTGCEEIKHIACVEILEHKMKRDAEENSELLLRKAFHTFRYVLESASEMGIKVRRVAMPILGAGKQKLKNREIVVPLIRQCLKAFKTIDELEEIVFYELDRDKLIDFAHDVKVTLMNYDVNEPLVFISYSSVYTDEAHYVFGKLKDNGVSCWIAPEGIPDGEGYMEHINIALSCCRAFVLLLTEPAMESPWVRKELGIAIGSGTKIFPYQKEEFDRGDDLRLPLENVQVYEAWRYGDRDYKHLIDEVTRYMRDAG